MAGSLTFDDLFQAVCNTVHTETGASLLVSLCKEFDLRRPEHGSAVELMATWITSPCEYFRQELVFALCLFRPVPGYAWVAIEGWKTAPVLDLHWYAGAIQNSFDRPDLVTPADVTTIAARLHVRAPTEETFDRSHFGFLEEALSERRTELCDTARALGHLCQLFGQTQGPPEPPPNAGPAELDSFAALWASVADQLVVTVSRSRADADRHPD